MDNPNGMEPGVRELFKAERERLGLTQPEVAAKGGATQGTISKIEIDPDYNPSVGNFKKALAGIGHTLSSFFAHIESGTGHKIGNALAHVDRPIRAEAPEGIPDFEEFGRAVAQYVRRIAREQAQAAAETRPRGRKGNRKDR